jgi:putative transcriptional regulator
MSEANDEEHDLIKAVQEMIAHKNGTLALTERKFSPPPVDVAEIRRTLGYNQKEFAEHFGFTLGAIRDWEQGRRQPERSARILLAVIQKNPQIVEQVLSGLS